MRYFLQLRFELLLEEESGFGHKISAPDLRKKVLLAPRVTDGPIFPIVESEQRRNSNQRDFPRGGDAPRGSDR